MGKKKPRQMPSTTRKSPSSIAFHAKLPKSPKPDHDPEMTATQNLNSTKKHLAWPDIAEKDVVTTTTVEVTTIVVAIEVVDIVAAAIINIAAKEVEDSTTMEDSGVVVSVVVHTTIKMLAILVSTADLPVMAMNIEAAAAEEQQELEKTNPFRPLHKFQFKRKNMFHGIENVPLRENSIRLQ